MMNDFNNFNGNKAQSDPVETGLNFCSKAFHHESLPERKEWLEVRQCDNQGWRLYKITRHDIDDRYEINDRYVLQRDMLRTNLETHQALLSLMLYETACKDVGFQGKRTAQSGLYDFFKWADLAPRNAVRFEINPYLTVHENIFAQLDKQAPDFKKDSPIKISEPQPEPARPEKPVRCIYGHPPPGI